MSQIDASRYEKVRGLYLPPEVRPEHADLANATGRPVRVMPPGFQALAGAYSPAPDPTSRDLTEPLGFSGVTVSGGQLINYDDNAGLTPRFWRGQQGQLGKVDVMRRSDPVVAAAWAALTLLIEETSFSVEPAPDGDAADLQAALLVRDAYFHDSRSTFRQYLSQAAEFPLRGTVMHELDWQVMRDGGEEYGIQGPYYTLGAFEPRMLSTVQFWRRYIDTPGRSRWGAVLYTDWSDRPVDAPGVDGWAGRKVPNLHPDRLVHLVWKPDGDAPEGIGMLRACHAAWAQRQTYTKLETAGFERAAFGIPYIEIQPGASRGNDKQLKQVLEQLAAGRYSNLMLPKGYVLKFAQFPFNADAIIKARMQAGRDIARATHTLQLYTGEENGTQALVDGHRSLLASTAQAVIHQIAELHSHGPNSHIHRLVDANYGKGTFRRYPRLQGGRAKDRDVKQLIEVFKLATDAGLLTPGADIEELVRQMLAAPEMSEETREAWLQRQKTPKVPTNIEGGDPPPAAADDDDDEPPDTQTLNAIYALLDTHEGELPFYHGGELRSVSKAEYLRGVAKFATQDEAKANLEYLRAHAVHGAPWWGYRDEFLSWCNEFVSVHGETPDVSDVREEWGLMFELSESQLVDALADLDL